MTSQKPFFDSHYHFLGNRLLTHALFWMLYYLLFSLLWAEDGKYYQSFGLELILLPLRILASYGVIYYLLPKYLTRQRESAFLMGYLVIVTIAGICQRLINHYYYELLWQNTAGGLWQFWPFVKAIVLINTTVMFITALKIFQLWRLEQYKHDDHEWLNIRADKRNFRIAPAEIQYIEALGNYVTYYLENGQKLISYQTLKEVNNTLPENFERIHKSFIINKNHVRSYSNENVEIGNRLLPIGKSIVVDFS